MCIPTDHCTLQRNHLVPRHGPASPVKPLVCSASLTQCTAAVPAPGHCLLPHQVTLLNLGMHQTRELACGNALFQIKEPQPPACSLGRGQPLHPCPPSLFKGVILHPRYKYMCFYIHITQGIQRQQTDHVLFINLKNSLGLACLDEHCPAPADAPELLQFFQVLLLKRMINSAHPFQGRSVLPSVPSDATINLSTFNITGILVLKQGLR